MRIIVILDYFFVQWQTKNRLKSYTFYTFLKKNKKGKKVYHNLHNNANFFTFFSSLFTVGYVKQAR